MIELQIIGQRYSCRTKDLLWSRETRQAISLMVGDGKTLNDIKILSETENLYNAASSSRANEIGYYIFDYEPLEVLKQHP